MWPLQLPREPCVVLRWPLHIVTCALHCHIRPASKLPLLMLKNDSYKLFLSVRFTKLLHVFTLMSKSSFMIAISSKRKSTHHSMSLNAETKLKVCVQLCWPCEITLLFFHFSFILLFVFQGYFLLHPYKLSNKQYHISFSSLQVNDNFNVTLPSEYEYTFLETPGVFSTACVK